MKRFVGLLLLFVSAPVAAEQVKLFDGAFSIDLPGGFRPMTQAEIQTKYPSRQPPQHCFTDNDGLAVSICMARITNANASPSRLEMVGDQMRQGISKQAGITMHRHAVVIMGGQQWYAIDFESRAIDQPVENRMRVAIREGVIVLLTVNAISRVFPEREKGLLAVLETAKLN